MKLISKKEKPLVTLDDKSQIMDFLTPIGFEFKRNEIEIGEGRARVYGIVKYPPNLSYGWLSDITNIPNTIACITYNPVDTGEFIDNLNSSIKRYRSDAANVTDPLEQTRAKKASTDGDELLGNIDFENQSIGAIGVQIMPLARTDKDFEKACRVTESKITTKHCKVRSMSNQQEQGFKVISPYYTNEKDIDDILQRVMPMETFLGGFPFSSSGFTDGASAKYILAHDSMGGLVNLDIWKRGGDRTNSNFVIMGQPGTGKSTFVKSLLINEFMMGTKILVDDPENEYSDVCRNLGGEVIDAGGGPNGIINPLQVRNAMPIEISVDIEEEVDTDNNIGQLLFHLQSLEVFFTLYIEDLNAILMATLNDTLIELYQNFKITWDTDISDFKNTDFPVMKDLYDLLIKKSQKPEADEDYNKLAKLIKASAVGKDKFLFGRHTTINSKARFQCINTSSLQIASDRVKKAQKYNIMSYMWEIMSFDKNEKVISAFDEAYLNIDEAVKQTLIQMKNMSKRCRKYESAIFIISHSVVDFLSPSIKKDGQALLDNPCYKILMGTDGKDLDEMKQLYKLTDAEERLLLKKNRGIAIGIIGSSRLSMKFVIPEHKLKLMGSAGGR